MTTTPPPQAALSSADDADRVGEPCTVVGDDWALEAVAADRLARVLDDAPPSVLGVAATSAHLAPGASTRTDAERAVLDAPAPTPWNGGRLTVGAARLRPGVPYERSDDGLVIDAAPGTLLVDAAAHVHDTWAPLGGIEVASPNGRPPFPWRPVVLLLGAEDDLDLADWARQLVNRLLELDIEARLAVPSPPDGRWLTRPCLPVPETVAALAPDVLVTLDDRAHRDAPGWCTLRRTVHVELDPRPATSIELVSWRLGVEQGRLRARLGQRARPAEVAALVQRLTAGPTPVPPRRTPDASEVGQLLPRPPRSGRATRPLTIGAFVHPDPTSRERIHDLLDRLEEAGHEVQLARGSSDRRALLDPEVLLLRGGDPAELLPIVDERRARGRTTVVDLLDEQLRALLRPIGDPAAAGDHDPVGAIDAELELAAACGRVLATGAVDLPGHRHLHVHVLGPLVSRAREVGLRTLRPPVEATPDPIIGWRVGPGADAARAIARALGELLDADAELRVVLDGVDGIPEGIPLRVRDRVLPLAADAEPSAARRWTALVVDDGEPCSTWATRVVADAVLLGVPVVTSAARTDVPALIAPRSRIERPERVESWLEPLRALATDPAERTRQAADVARRADALVAERAPALAINRLTGWLRAELP